MSSIKVTNNSGAIIEVAINHWGKGGETSFYEIGAGKSGDWGREDGRGFVMVVTKHNDDRSNGAYYFVKAGASITVNHVNNDVQGVLNKLDNPY
jgi:hypothetical protein